MSRSRFRNLFGSTLLVAGAITYAVELLRYWIMGHTIHPAPSVLGFVLAIGGAFAVDPQSAKVAGDFFVTSSVRVLAVMRTGRRSTDVKTIVAAEPQDYPPGDDGPE